MKKLELNPDGFECSFGECPPGLFLYDKNVFFKSEYTTNGRPDAYCDSGEYFCAGKPNPEDISALIVQPLLWEWVEK